MTCERTTFYRCDKLFNSFLQLHLLAFATHFDHIDPMGRQGETNRIRGTALCLIYLFAIQVIDLYLSRIAHIEVKTIRPYTGALVGYIFYSIIITDIFNIPTLWYSAWTIFDRKFFGTDEGAGWGNIDDPIFRPLIL